MENIKSALCSPLSKGSANSKGYFANYLGNVYGNKMNEEHRKMFERGSGSELQSKARAVHSSSMLGYNFFSWINERHPFVWEDVTYKEVYFEVRLRTIKRSPAPANMDIVLDGINKDGKRVLLFIESKFLEYTNYDKIDLSESYLKPDNYYIEGPWSDVAEVLVKGKDSSPSWSEVANELVLNTKYDKQYNGGIKQSFCHLVALNALQCEKALAWFNANNVLKIDNLSDVEIRFMNAIFFPNEKFEDEHNKYREYKELYECFMRFIERIAPYSVQPKWFSYSDIWKQMKSQINDQDRIAFLQRRYMDFAEICK